MLRVENLGRRYRRRRPWALRRVSFELRPGAMAALVGPNGAGKSTLIRACLGFERPDEGRILVGGVDPQRSRTRAVATLAYVPQSRSLYRGLTIADHLTLAAGARRHFDYRYASQRLESLGLAARRRVGDLSTGEQAQVALTLALGTRAPLLLLDEPLASLDPLARREFLTTLIDHVRQHGSTVLLSSHIVTDVEQSCDWLLVLAEGRLVLDSGVQESRMRFRTVAAVDLNGVRPIGTFAGPDGLQLALVSHSGVGRPASVEEIVLGHLAVGRAAPAVR